MVLLPSSPTSPSIKLRREDTSLLFVDIQVRLAAAMPPEALDSALRAWVLLVETAGRLRLPTAVSEQYPKGLGPTLPVLRESIGKLAPPARFFEKLDFSAADHPILTQFLGQGRRTVIVVGMESHVCVYQTVRDLVQRGFVVHVPVDAVVSRRDIDYDAALRLYERAGAIVTSTEVVVFDLLGRAEGEEFKALSRLIKLGT